MSYKYRSVVAAAIGALASGTPYLYSSYAPQLLAQCDLDVDTYSSTFAFFLTMGTSLMGIPSGIIVDNFGPRIATVLGSLFTLLSYLTLGHVFETTPKNAPSLISASLCVMGTGAMLTYYSAMKCTTSNFPKARGAVTSIPVSMYALSSMMFAALVVYIGDVGRSFNVIAISCFTMMALCIYDFRIVQDVALPTSSAVSISSSTSGSHTLTMSRDLRGSLSFWGVGNKKVDKSLYTSLRRTSNASDNDSVYMNGPVNVLWDNHVVRALTDWRFIRFFLIQGLLSGIGQQYIYSVGFIVTTKRGGKVDAEYQSLQVSVIAISSFIGRLFAGSSSDWLVNNSWQRLWNIEITCTLMGLAAFLITLKGDYVTYASIALGIGYGILYGTFPAIIADTFGTDGFSTVWGVATTSGLLGIKLFGVLYAYNAALSWWIIIIVCAVLGTLGITGTAYLNRR